MLDVGRNYGAHGARLFWKVILPAALPAIFTGLRLGLGLALVTLVAVEFIAAKSGLGHLVFRHWQMLSTPEMYAAFALIGIIVAAAAWAIRHRQLRFHPMIWALLAVSGVIYLALPRVLFASYMADQRMPIAIAFMLVACVDLELRHRLVRRGFLAVLLLVWWIVTMGPVETRLVSPVVLPSPAEVFGSFGSLVRERALVQSIAATLKRVLLGFGLAILIGVPVGIAAGSWPST